jgi:hypothetical protein
VIEVGKLPPTETDNYLDDVGNSYATAGILANKVAIVSKKRSVNG